MNQLHATGELLILSADIKCVKMYKWFKKAEAWIFQYAEHFHENEDFSVFILNRLSYNSGRKKSQFKCFM